MRHSFQAIVLAGGLGTRLRSVLGRTPKVIAPVDGKPWLAWVLQSLAASGFTRVCLALGYGREAVRQALEAHDFGSMEILYSEETEPLGTGGALRFAAKTLPRLPTFALNGDTWVDVPWATMLKKHIDLEGDLSIAIRHVKDRSRYGAIELRDRRIVAFGEKEKRGPGYINAGVYLLDPAHLLARDVPERFSFEKDFVQKRLTSLQMIGFVVDGPFLDIGIPADLARAGKFLRDLVRRQRAGIVGGSKNDKA